MVTRILFFLVLQAVIGAAFGTGAGIAGSLSKGVSRRAQGRDVIYDGRSLIIGGHRKILFSGSIHYPRSTPEMWPSLIRKAKEGGLDVIDTYVFWNLHEPHRGQYDFSGRRDIVRFIKLVQAQGLYVCLRIGPFIEAEWSYGGLPFWLHNIPGIVYRSDNKPYKAHMKNFTTKIVKMMQSEKLYAPQGGPIILSQIENEYGLVEENFRRKGLLYVHWAAKMATGLKTGVPWVMCKQDDAPDPVINTCNGQKCGVNFDGPNSPNKPSIWSENWTTRFQVYGKDAKVRSAEDIAFHTALFIVAKNGSFVNYYMYHGGTNFGRTAAAFVTTSYYDQAPLDEYGLIRQPKWGHLRDLHAAIKRCSRPLLSGVQRVISLGQLQRAYIFNGPSRKCAAFLVNDDKNNVASVEFRNISYDLLPKSISILPDCKNVAFNTAKVSAQYNTRTMMRRKIFSVANMWKEFKEVIPSFDDTSIKSSVLLEQMKTTKDASDYLWYTFRVKHKSSHRRAVLRVRSAGHVLHAFVNGKAVGSGRRSYESKIFNLRSKIALGEGINNVSLLSVMVGLPDSGAYLEHRVAGLRRVTIRGKGFAKQFTKHPMGYQVGLMGEKVKIFTPEASNLVQWNKFSSTRRPLTWYQTLFDAPGIDAPVALNLGSMGKGEAWVNGKSIGRYWPSYLTPAGSSQIWYHIPRSFLKPRGNLLVLLEEEGGDPLKVSLDTASISQVCSYASNHLPTGSPLIPHRHRTRVQRKINGRQSELQLSCLSNSKISNILFASYGTPLGTCGVNYSLGMCHAPNSKAIAEKACLGNTSCSIPISSRRFGGDPCPAKAKSLLVVAECK